MDRYQKLWVSSLAQIVGKLGKAKAIDAILAFVVVDRGRQ
jgi:hypothetical protein